MQHSLNKDGFNCLRPWTGRTQGGLSLYFMDTQVVHPAIWLFQEQQLHLQICYQPETLIIYRNESVLTSLCEWCGQGLRSSFVWYHFDYKVTKIKCITKCLIQPDFSLCNSNLLLLALIIVSFVLTVNSTGQFLPPSQNSTE